MPTNTAQTIQGLAAQIADMTLETPASYEMAHKIGTEMLDALEAVYKSLDNARFEQTWGHPLPLEQDDSAAADGTEVPLHPVFRQVVGFMAPQQVRR